MLKKMMMAAAIVSGAGLSAPVVAQPVFAGGLVNVNIQDVDILNDLNLSAPITVQVPIGVAANVCNINAAVLATQYVPTGAPCEAQNSTQALANIVSRNQQ